MYDTFILKTKTKDNKNIIVGAFCKKGSIDTALKNVKNKIENSVFGESLDEYFIDFKLSEILKYSCENQNIDVAGASIKINDVENRTGGILGSIYSDSSSASGDIEKTCHELYIFSYPGGPGIVSSSEKDIVKASKIIKSSQHLSQKAIRHNVIKELSSSSQNFMYVADGSGKYSEGCIITKNGSEFFDRV